jgi:hypothetical protein
MALNKARRTPLLKQCGVEKSCMTREAIGDSMRMPGQGVHDPGNEADVAVFVSSGTAESVSL